MRLLKRLGFSLLVAAVIGLAILNVLVWNGFLVHEELNAARPKTTRKAGPPPIRAKQPSPSSTASRTTPTVPVKPEIPVSTIILTASRGDCWVVAKSGSAQGPVLYEGLLRSGESTRLRANRVWLSLGAAANIDVVIDGKPEQLPGGTVELLLPRGSRS